VAVTLAAVGALAAGAPALAGPPYVTDDPEPTDLGRWEIYQFANGTHAAGATTGEAGLDLNYGGATDLQLTAVIPLAYDPEHTGLGSVELAAKLKVLHQETAGLDLAIFPRVFLPTPEARFGPRHVNLLLPVWAGRGFGPWSVFGGGGYTLNPGPGQRDFWTAGIAATRAITPRLSLGAEVYHQTRDAADARAFTGVNLGMTYQVAEHWSVLAAGGPGVQNARQQGDYDFYVALLATY
jgi:hypothetical protein